MPENQTACNSDIQGIKEKINRSNQTGKARPAEENHDKVADWVGGANLRAN